MVITTSLPFARYSFTVVSLLHSEAPSYSDLLAFAFRSRCGILKYPEIREPVLELRLEVSRLESVQRAQLGFSWFAMRINKKLAEVKGRQYPVKTPTETPESGV